MELFEGQSCLQEDAPNAVLRHKGVRFTRIPARRMGAIYSYTCLVKPEACRQGMLFRCISSKASIKYTTPLR